MNCPVCGAANETSAAFCFRCGTPLTQSTPGATGPTVSLNRGDSPSFPSTATITPTDADSHARVYDAPPNTGNQTFTVPPGPQYSQPGQYQSNTAMYGVTSNTAIFALISGIVSFVLLPVVCAILAIVLGRNAQQEIRASGGRLTGEGLAQAGIILGWINIALSVLGLCAFCVLPILLASLGASVSP